MTAPSLARVFQRPMSGNAAGIVALLALILLLHGSSLDHGLFMDDHAHFRQLREADWSFGALVDACRLELVGGVIDLWFLPECTLRFFRPLAFGVMKLTYTLGGWEPLVMHAASLGWHALVCFLLFLLLRALGGGRLMAWAVTALFASHPGHIATVQWLACQTELMATAFLLVAALAYLRFRGGTAPTQGSATGALPWALLCVLAFVAALGCRENAIMFPFVMLGVELTCWRRKTRQAVILQGVLLVVAAIYLIIRWSYLREAAIPPRPYVIPPGAADFPRFIFDKLCYYLLGEFFLAPIVPFGGIAYLRERPLLFYGATAAIVALLVVVYGLQRDRRAGWLGLTWLLGFLAPLLPVFASPHHLYLPGIGWAVTTMLLFERIGGEARATERRRRGAMWALLLVLLGGSVAATLTFSEVIDTAQRVEDLVIDQVAARAAHLHDGDTLYLANLPLIAHYVRLGVEEQTGLRNLHVEALTWSPRVLGLVGTKIQSELIWLDERTCEIHVTREPYFSGTMGYLAAQSTGNAVPRQHAADRGDDGFRVEVLQVETEGVSALRFTFDRRITAPSVHFFWGSRVLWAFEVEPTPESQGG